MMLHLNTNPKKRWAKDHGPISLKSGVTTISSFWVESLGCFITATGTWLGHPQLHPRDLPALTVLLQQPSGKLTCKNHYHHYGKREGWDAPWFLSHFRSFSLGNGCIPLGPKHLAGYSSATGLCECCFSPLVPASRGWHLPPHFCQRESCLPHLSSQAWPHV